MQRMFVGRTSEYQALRERLDKPGFQMVSLYGRRRIGKTTLINKFVDEANLPTVSYVALERNEGEQLEMLGEAVLATLAPELLGTVSFDSFEKIYTFIAQQAKSRRVIFVIDEYPYLAKECPYMNSLIQRFVDREWADTQLYLIICGSLVSFMRDSVLGEHAPLHGRSTLEMRLRPLDYLDSSLFVPHYSCEDKAIVYGLTGGVPKYLEQFDDTLTLDENIKRQFFSNTGYFGEEQMQTLVTADRTNPAAFNTIISSVARGHTKYGEIASDVGGGDISYYLKSLVAADILEKRQAAGKPYYRLSDAMIRFWFGYVSRASSIINAGRGAPYYEQVVKERLHEHMGPVFEDMARQYLFAHMGCDKLPFFATEIEEYQATVLGPDGKPRQVELDLMGKNGSHILFVAECKFRNQLFDLADLQKLEDKVALLPIPRPRLIVFSLDSFTKEVLASDVLAISIDKMYDAM